MKSIAVALMLMLPSIFLGQGVFTNQTCIALQKVIGDYSNNFRNIQGDVVSKEGQSTDYTSKVMMPGAESAVVTKYNSSGNKNIYTWRCRFASSEDFSVIAKKYKSLYDQIRNSIIKIDGRKPYILSGTYEPPTEDKKFNTTDFYLLPSSGDMKKVKVELSLEYYVTEWKMSILVYDQTEEDAFVKE